MDARSTAVVASPTRLPTPGDSAAPTTAPLFSVVVPTFRRPELLPRAVASVLAQTVADLECIVVDDGGGAALVLPDDPRLRVVVRDRTGGPAAAVNSGVAAARGRYLAFLNDDDLWTPERLQLALAGLARSEVTVCWSRHLDEAPGPKPVLDGDASDVILDRITPNLGATALATEAWVPLDESLAASEDVEWWWRTAARHEIATVTAEGLLVRRHDEVRVHHGDAARARASVRLLSEQRAWFRAHPDAEAFRWFRVGMTARRSGDPAIARVAFERSLRSVPSARAARHLVRAWAAMLAPLVGPGASDEMPPVESPAAGDEAAPSLRILQVITDRDRRGAQVFAEDLGDALEARGHDVRTVALGPGRSDVGVRARVLGRRRWSATGLARLRAAARRADVVVAHGSTTLPASAIATFGCGTPFVYRQISESRFWASTSARRWRVRLALAMASRIVALAPSQAAVLHEEFSVPAGRLRVVPNGVPASAFAPVGDQARRHARAAFGLPADAPVVLSIGALVPEKGTDVVVDAVASLPGVYLLVVGAGPERSAIERRAARLAPERIVVRGPLSTPVDAYRAADVLVLASKGGDSMPATLIEAALCGVPSVATPVGAIADTIIDGVTGSVVAASATSVAGAVGDLLADPTRRAAMGRAARQVALDRFEIGVVAAGWERVLDEVRVPAQVT